MTDDSLDLAEKYILRGEAAGMAHATPGERASAKLAIAEGFRKEQKQDTSGTGGSAASEPGGVVGATSGGGGDAEAITDELNSLMQKRATHAVMAERRKLRDRMDAAMGDVQVVFTRD